MGEKPTAADEVERKQGAEQQDQNGGRRGTKVLQRHRDDQDDHDELVGDRLEEVLERVPDQAGAVVRRNDFDPFGKRRPERLEPRKQGPGHGEDIPALFHDDDAADDFPGSVEVGNSAPQVVTDLQVPDILEVHGRAVSVAAENQKLEVTDALGPHPAPQLILAVGDLYRAAARLLKRALQRAEHALQRQAPLGEERREQLHLILLLETADRRHFRHTGRRLQHGLDDRLVQQAKVAEIAHTLPIEQRILEDPAHAAGIRTDNHAGVGRQLRSNGIQPVRYELADRGTARRVGQDHVHKGVPHVRRTPDRPHVG